MAAQASYPVGLGFSGDTHIERWRPLVQWLLAVPQLIVVWALQLLRNALTVVAFFTVVITKEIPRPIFDLTVMTYRYEWRVLSYALFLREDYPPFDFSSDDGATPADHASVSIEYPGEMNRWKPLYKWFLAIPHFVILVFLALAGIVIVLVGFVAVLVTAEYPTGLRDRLVAMYRYGVRVQAYVGLLTDQYPPFSLST